MKVSSALFDASVLVSLFLPFAATPVVRSYLGDNKLSVGVSDFASGEFAAAVSRHVRMKEITSDWAAALLALFDRWIRADAFQVATAEQDMRLAASFVRNFDLKLSMADALYVAAAQRLGLPLATIDTRQANAARQLGISLVDFGT